MLKTVDKGTKTRNNQYKKSVQMKTEQRLTCRVLNEINAVLQTQNMIRKQEKEEIKLGYK